MTGKAGRRPLVPGDPGLSADYRSLMAEFPTGVAIVTATEGEGQPRGMTCSALCSLSIAPPALLVCLRRESPTLDSVKSSASFVVNLLHEGSRKVAELFGSGDPKRFEKVRWTGGAAGPHMVGNAHALAGCTVRSLLNAGTHTIVVGEVVYAWQLSDRAPLLYGRRHYVAWPE
ncbi:flavin reductase family protein [Streptomyces sp. x-80]|uniref:flavin reductase family protein n=1 Tax=Streptomyces sp. x-80 TaxID=2789282 RepID=UPI0039803E29